MGEGSYRKENTGYQALANAVVEQAAKDYLRALKRLKIDPRNLSGERMKKECEIFFCSDWFRELTDVDGRWLMETLGREQERNDS